jgi:uncharacterized protein
MDKAYAIIAWDGPEGAARRDTFRAQHFAHIETILDKVLIAGPLKDASGAFTGSLVVVKADSEDEARAIFESDPYFAAGVWDRWDIQFFLPAAGDWIGGKIW